MTILGIIQSASQIDVSGTLVLGRPSDGKSTAVIREVQRQGYNPLVIVATNADTYKKEVEWDVALVSSWKQFIELLTALSAPEGVEFREKYDAIIVEGINYLASMVLPETDVTQKDYLEMGRKVSNRLLTVRNGFGNLYVVLDVILTDEGELGYSINRDLYNRIISIFGQKWFCYSLPPTKEFPNPRYMVQKNSTLAIRYVEAGGVENS